MSIDTILDFWEPSEEPTVVLRYFYVDGEAQLAALQLRQSGIPSFITSSNAQTMLPTGQGWIGLHVRERDFDGAVQSLIVADMWNEEAGGDSKKTNTSWVLWVLAAMLASFVLAYLLQH